VKSSHAIKHLLGYRLWTLGNQARYLFCGSHYYTILKPSEDWDLDKPGVMIYELQCVMIHCDIKTTTSFDFYQLIYFLCCAAVHILTITRSSVVCFPWKTRERGGVETQDSHSPELRVRLQLQHRGICVPLQGPGVASRGRQQRGRGWETALLWLLQAAHLIPFHQETHSYL